MKACYSTSSAFAQSFTFPSSLCFDGGAAAGGGTCGPAILILCGGADEAGVVDEPPAGEPDANLASNALSAIARRRSASARAEPGPGNIEYDAGSSQPLMSLNRVAYLNTRLPSLETYGLRVKCQLGKSETESDAWLTGWAVGTNTGMQIFRSCLRVRDRLQRVCRIEGRPRTRRSRIG